MTVGYGPRMRDRRVRSILEYLQLLMLRYEKKKKIKTKKTTGDSIARDIDAFAATILDGTGMLND